MNTGKAKLVLFCLAGLFSTTAFADPLRELALHFALKTNQPPVLDGKLDEACWKQAPEFTRYRVRTKLPKGKAAQKTSLKIVWGDRGIYFGITNYEKKLDALKVSVRTRNGGYIWADDSAELYIDPTATGYTMFKFDINSVGAIGDFWQVDMGFTDYNWSASSAKAVCGKTADAWVIEYFVSWDDLKKKPQVGSIWMLIHRRLEYSSGKLVDSSSSGGIYHDRKFGFIYFINQTVPAPEQQGEKLLKLVSPDWVLPINGKWLWATGKQVTVSNEKAILKSLRQQAKTSLGKAAKLLKLSSAKQLTPKLKKLRKRFEEATEKKGFAAMAEFSAVAAEAVKINKEIQFMELMSE